MLSSLSMIAPTAHAWDATPSGKISTVEVTNGGNFGIRIWFEGTPTMCPAGARWAFLNETDSNYKVFVAAIMMAKAQGSTVTVYTNNMNGAFCHIGHIIVSS